MNNVRARLTSQGTRIPRLQNRIVLRRLQPLVEGGIAASTRAGGRRAPPAHRLPDLVQEIIRKKIQRTASYRRSGGTTNQNRPRKQGRSNGS